MKQLPRPGVTIGRWGQPGRIRSQLPLIALALAGVVVLAPALTRPTYAILAVLALAALALAGKSVAFPLGLAGVPTLIAAVTGSNPLPKGGTTFLFSAWIAVAIALALMRREETVATWSLMSLPVAMAFLLLGLMLLRLGPSAAQSYGSTKVQLYVADNLIFMVGAIFAGARAQSRRLFLIVTLAVTVGGALFLISQLLSGSANQEFAGRFALSVQEGPIYLGRDSATGVLIAIFLIISSPPGRTRLLAGASLPLLIVSLIAAGSRGPMVAFIVGLGVMLILTMVGGRGRRELGGVIALLLLAAVLVPVLVPGSAVGRSLSTIIGSASGLSSNGRSAIWANAYSQFANHTFFGLGTGGFAAVDPVNAYPHNILLEMAVELGVVGLVAVSLMIGSMLSRMASAWRETAGQARLEVSLLIALFVMALVNSFFSGAIQDNRDIWVWGGLALAIHTRRKLVAQNRVLRTQPLAPVNDRAARGM